MALHMPAYVFVIDHGSRSGPPVVDGEHTALVIDHHHATESDFPKDAEHVTACHSPPVATSSLLTYEICQPLHPEVKNRCAWLCIVSTPQVAAIPFAFADTEHLLHRSVRMATSGTL